MVNGHGQGRKSWWGGNLGGAGGGPPPPPSRKIAEFSEILTKRGLKTVFSSANGGGVVGNLGGFAPPTGKSEFPPLVMVMNLDVPCPFTN